MYRAPCSICQPRRDYLPGFERIVDLKKMGLVIYHYALKLENTCPDDTRTDGKPSHTILDVYILHNSKDIVLKREDFLLEMDKWNIPCGRCQKLRDIVLKLLLRIPAINRKMVMAICDHCKCNDHPCFNCLQVIKKFCACKKLSNEDPIQRVKEWVTKVKKLADTYNQDNKESRDEKRPSSELPIDRSQNLSSSERELEIPEQSDDSQALSHPKYNSLESKLSVSENALQLQKSHNTKSVSEEKQTNESHATTDISEQLHSSTCPFRCVKCTRESQSLLDRKSKSENIQVDSKRTHVEFKFKQGSSSTHKLPLITKSDQRSGKPCSPACFERPDNYFVFPRDTQHSVEKFVVQKTSSELIKDIIMLQAKSEEMKDHIKEKYIKETEEKTKLLASREKQLEKLSSEQLKLLKNMKRGQNEKEDKDSTKLMSKKIPRSEDKEKNLNKLTPQSTKIKEHKQEQTSEKRKQADNLGSKSSTARERKKEKGDRAKDSKLLWDEAGILNLNKIKIDERPNDDMISDLVKIEQSKKEAKKKDSQFLPPEKMKVIKENVKSETIEYRFYSDSDFEMFKTGRKNSVYEIIKGERVSKQLKVAPTTDKEKQEGLLVEFDDDGFLDIDEASNILEQTAMTKTKRKGHAGVIQYALSDRKFIDNGWTILPKSKVMRKLNVYRMHPANPEYNWFENIKDKDNFTKYYKSGELLAKIHDDGRGCWHYKNGRIALEYFKSEDMCGQQRFVVYSNGESDERGRPRPYTTLATFDYQGNGIVFDHGGEVRLKYTQSEGVVLDTKIGPASHWKWHSLNEPPVLEQTMIENHMLPKDTKILEIGTDKENVRVASSEVLDVEFSNKLKAINKYEARTFKPFQIKMKALKINENFSLKVLDQAHIYLLFRDGTTNLKLNIGMFLDSKEIVDTNVVDVEAVANDLEAHSAPPGRLADLQKSIVNAKRFEKSLTNRERRLRPILPRNSADKLISAVSRPVRRPIIDGTCKCPENRKVLCEGGALNGKN